MTGMNTRLFRPFFALLLFVAAPASGDDLHRGVAVRSGGTLRVDLNRGSVEVETHDELEIRVDANATGVGADATDFELTSDGVNAELRGRSGGNWFNWLGGARLRVRVRIPEMYSVDIRTGAGDVEIEDLGGSAKVETNGGRIEVDGAHGSVELRTSGGPIHVEDVEGDLDAQTAGGRVRISDVHGDVDARTSGGGMTVHDVIGSVRAKTSGGSISVRFDGQPSGEVETSGGGIEVTVPEDSAFELEASTSGGRVRLADDLDCRGKSSSNEVEGEVNGGGPRLRLRTSGGNIRVRAD